MEVITIQSEAFNEIMNSVQEIKEILRMEKDKQPLSELWLDTKQVCILLKLTMRTLQTYRDEGIIGYSQINSKIYYKASDIEDLLESHYVKPNAQ